MNTNFDLEGEKDWDQILRADLGENSFLTLKSKFEIIQKLLLLGKDAIENSELVKEFHKAEFDSIVRRFWVDKLESISTKKQSANESQTQFEQSLKSLRRDINGELEQFVKNQSNEAGYLVKFISQIGALRATELSSASIEPKIQRAIKESSAEIVDRVNSDFNNLKVQNDDFAKKIAEKYESSSESTVNQKLEELNTLKDKITPLLTELQNKAGEKTFETYAIAFADEARKHSDSIKFWPWDWSRAQGWMVVTILSIVCLIGIFFLLSAKLPIEELKENPITKETHYIYNVTNLFTRIILVSIGVFLLTFSIRQYSIEKHLGTLNLHRSNTLNTIKLFMESTSDQDLKDQMIAHLAKTIFETQRTGFLSDRGVAMPTSPGGDIFKIITPK